MSKEFLDIVKNVGETISQLLPGLSLSKFITDVGDEGDRLMQLGASEAVNGLHHGQAFVLYGPNQRPGAGDKEIQSPEAPAIESPEQSHGMSM
jgi:hypothetical protein